VRQRFEQVKQDITSQGLSVDFSEDEAYLDEIESRIEALKTELGSKTLDFIKERFEEEVMPMYLELKRRLVFKIYSVMADRMSERVLGELDNMRSRASKDGIIVDFSDIESELSSLVAELKSLAEQSAAEQSQTLEDDEDTKTFDEELRPRFERLFVKARIKLYTAYGEKIKNDIRARFESEIENIERQNITVDSSAIDEKLAEFDVLITELQAMQDSANPQELQEKIESLEERVQKITRDVHVVLIDILAGNFLELMRGKIVEVKQQFLERGISLDSSLIDAELIAIEGDIENWKLKIKAGDDAGAKVLEEAISARWQNFQVMAASVLFIQLLDHQYSGADAVIGNYEEAGRDMSAWRAEMVNIKAAVDDCDAHFDDADYAWVVDNCRPEEVFKQLNLLGKQESDVI
jgi:hypothetical protein